ncbi:MAG: glycosyltransferase involved in cell wall biosynthesis [Psychroserpens sp.]|jgi:glycosyltransferase involved in cell wall biosynthesis
MKDSDMAHTVTILMPCYNTSMYLEQALQSILSQTYKNIIILVLDDGSSDKSLQIA